MTARELEAYLHAHIPISAGMAVRVVESSERRVRVSAPLMPNFNHRATAFGGSVSALAILAGWAWLHLVLQARASGVRLVIQRNSVEYLAPIEGEFEAHCAGLSSAALDRFVRTLRRVGKARATLRVEVTFAGKSAADFEGDYVAVSQ